MTSVDHSCPDAGLCSRSERHRWQTAGSTHRNHTKRAAADLRMLARHAASCAKPDASTRKTHSKLSSGAVSAGDGTVSAAMGLQWLCALFFCALL